jgi:hypothetical protein
MNYTIILALIMLALSPRSVAGIITSSLSGSVSFSNPAYSQAGQKAVSAALIQSGIAQAFDSAESQSIKKVSDLVVEAIGTNAVSAIGVTALVVRTVRDRSIMFTFNDKSVSLGVNSVGLSMTF